MEGIAIESGTGTLAGTGPSGDSLSLGRCRRGSALAVLAVVLACSACSNDGGPSIQADLQEAKAGDVSGDGRGDACTPACDGKECGPNGCGGECGTCAALTEQCGADGSCEPFPCKSSKECPGNLVCADELSQCVGCVGDEDCPEGLTCGGDFACHEEHPCDSDKDCKQFDLVCDKEANKCVECLKPEHCGVGQYCKDRWCIDAVCTPSESKCEGSDVLLCAADGSGWAVSLTCGDVQYCEAGECKDYVCAPSEVFCADDVYKVCSDDGKSIHYEEDCAAKQQHCFNGQCLPTICEPGAKFCSDPATAATCLGDGMDFSKLPCDAGQYCDGTKGECVAQVCPPGKAECAGTLAKTCNAIGSGYASQVDCKPLGKVCVDGKCMDCVKDCAGKQCGDDGCGGVCGTCTGDEVCKAGICAPPGMDCNNDGVDDQCPDLAGYVRTCNPQQHCEYANADATGWKKWDVWIWIPPGSFMMGSPDSEEGHEAVEAPVHQVTFAMGYFIGKYEVVVEQYEACVVAGGCTWKMGCNNVWSWGLNTTANGRGDHPQNCLCTPPLAQVCAWLAPGGRLSSEAEWEYAASGPTHRKYPWGDTPEPTCQNDTAVFDGDGESGRPLACDPCTPSGCSGTKPVGTKPAGAAWCGALDMAGNAAEWVADKWHPNYQGAPTDGSAWAGNDVASVFVLRGGAAVWPLKARLRTSDRQSPAWDCGDPFSGGRCARDVK